MERNRNYSYAENPRSQQNMTDNKRHKLSFGDVHPELIAQWHPTKNGTVSPFNVAMASNRKVWWCCVKGHEWIDSVCHRHAGRGCPICSNRIVLIGYNDFAHAYPELATQWHPTKNGALSPVDITKSSNKKVWWICSKGHEWQAPVARRIDGHGCPYCANRSVQTGYNDFAHEHPELIASWDSVRNVGIDPHKITSMSDKVVWWKCEFGHSYRTTVKHRSQGTACPKCAIEEKAQKLIKEHALNFIARFHKANKNFHVIELLGEYTGVWEKLKCRCKVCGFEWKTTPANLLDGCGCPRCACTQTSFQEQFIYTALVRKLGMSNVVSRIKTIIGMELDIFVPSWKFAIEIGAWNWHKDKIERDEEKFQLCQNLGIELLTIYDSCHNSIQKSALKHCWVFRNDLGTEKTHHSLKAIVTWIFKRHGCPYEFPENEWKEIEEEAFKRSRRSENGLLKSRQLRSDRNSRKLTHEDTMDVTSELRVNAIYVEKYGTHRLVH